MFFGFCVNIVNLQAAQLKFWCEPRFYVFILHVVCLVRRQHIMQVTPLRRTVASSP